jgi:hypothetical protein
MTETAKTGKRQPTSDLSTKEIWELFTADDLSQEEFFEILESHNIHPGDIEELLGNETTRAYEQWMYFNIK